MLQLTDLHQLQLHKGLLYRTVTNQTGQIYSIMEGYAQFTSLSESTFRYFESVHHQTNEICLPATQSYLYTFEGNALYIQFNESPPRPFVSLPAQPIFLCGQDRYTVNQSYEGQTLTTQIAVVGPKKQYTISTTVKYNLT